MYGNHPSTARIGASLRPAFVISIIIGSALLNGCQQPQTTPPIADTAPAGNGTTAAAVEVLKRPLGDDTPVSIIIQPYNVLSLGTTAAKCTVDVNKKAAGKTRHVTVVFRDLKDRTQVVDTVERDIAKGDNSVTFDIPATTVLKTVRDMAIEVMVENKKDPGYQMAGFLRIYDPAKWRSDRAVVRDIPASTTPIPSNVLQTNQAGAQVSVTLNGAAQADETVTVTYYDLAAPTTALNGSTPVPFLEGESTNARSITINATNLTYPLSKPRDVEAVATNANGSCSVSFTVRTP